MVSPQGIHDAWLAIAFTLPPKVSCPPKTLGVASSGVTQPGHCLETVRAWLFWF